MYVIKNGTIHTGTGEVLENYDILIEGEKIKKIEKNICEADAEIIDATGKQVFPGFIDPHSSIGAMGIPTRYRDNAETTNVINPDLSVKYAIDPDEVNAQEFYKSGTVRPSGHKMGDSWTNNNGGSIPPNLLQIPNSESNSQYMRHCKELGVTRHPARFPYKLPEFFIKMLTDENDLVVDIFSGSNTTGKVAEDLSRRWLSIDLDCNYVAGSVFRFTDDIDEAKSYYDEISNGGFISLH